MNTAQAMQQDYAQFVLRMYSEALQQTKKNCETAGQLVQNMTARPIAPSLPSLSPHAVRKTPARSISGAPSKAR